MANAKFTLLEKKTTDDNKQSDCIIKNAGDFKKTRHFTESFAACLAKIFHIFPYTFKNEKNVFPTFPYENSETRFSRREIRHTHNNNKKIS
jgi:hypothetical protein